MATEISITLPAIDPEALLGGGIAPGTLRPTPFIRIVDGKAYGAGGGVDVEIRGTQRDVLQFIADNWGDEEADYQLEILNNVKADNA